MLRLKSYSLYGGTCTLYRLDFDQVDKRQTLGRLGIAQAVGKTLTKAEVYRACFKDFLLNNQDAAKSFALGKALTRQEFRYFKQAYKALPPCTDFSPLFWNYLEVVAVYAYTKAKGVL